MPAWREEIARHARLAEELRLPVFQWYTPLWAAVRGDARRPLRRRRAPERRGGSRPALRAGDRNAELFAGHGALLRTARARGVRRNRHRRSSRTRSPTRPRASPTAARTPGSSPAAARPSAPATSSTRRWRCPHAFDANWLSLQAECAEASILLGRRHPRRHPLRAARALRGSPRHRRPRRLQLRRGRPPPRRTGRAARPTRRRDAPPRRRHSSSTTRSAAPSGAQHAERHLARIRRGPVTTAHLPGLHAHGASLQGMARRH